MKKIIIFIISFTIFLSSQSNTFAEEGYIERLLDLNYGVEELTLGLSELEYVQFNTAQYDNMYNELKNADGLLRTEFMKKYRNGEYTYSQINGIITNYNNFIYYTNKFFYYLKLKESGYSYTELDSAMIKSFTNMRNSYRHVQNNAK